MKRFTVAAQGVHLSVFPTTLDGRPLLSGELQQPVWFGAAIPGSSIKRTLVIKNATPVPVPFKWLTRPAGSPSFAAGAPAVTFDEAEGEGGSGSPGNGDGGSAGAAALRGVQDGWAEGLPSEWHIEPFFGTMAPRSEVTVHVTFSPFQARAGVYSCLGACALGRRPKACRRPPHGGTQSTFCAPRACSIAAVAASARR